MQTRQRIASSRLARARSRLSRWRSRAAARRRAAEPPALVWRSVAAPVRGGEIAALAFDRRERDARARRPARRARRPARRRLRASAAARPGARSRLPRRRERRVAARRDRARALPGRAGRRRDRGLPGAGRRGPRRRTVSRSPPAGSPSPPTTASSSPAMRAAGSGPRRLSRRRRDGASRCASAQAALECWAVVAGEPWSAQLVADGRGARGARVPAPDRLLRAPRTAAPSTWCSVRRGPTSPWCIPLRSRCATCARTAGAACRSSCRPAPRRCGLAAGAGRLFLATLRGLLVAESLEGPWRRAEPPGGLGGGARARGRSRACSSRRPTRGCSPAPSLRRARPASTRSERRLELPEEPGIEQVHRAALAYLRLGPEPHGRAAAWRVEPRLAPGRRRFTVRYAHDESRATASRPGRLERSALEPGRPRPRPRPGLRRRPQPSPGIWATSPITPRRSTSRARRAR